MLWRYNWVKHRRKIFNPLSFSSTYSHFSSKVRENREFSRENTTARIPLTHDNVYVSLRESSSDLKTLKFFFWCARQNNYFHDDRAFDHMVSVLGKLTLEFDNIHGIIKELKAIGCVIKPRVFLLLLEIFWRGQVYDKVIDVYTGMSEFGYFPNTRAMNMSMDMLFKIGHVDKAFEVFEGIQTRNFFSFDIALSNLCSNGDWVNLKVIVRMMIREGFYPNEKRFEQIINVLSKAVCISEVFQVLCLMICQGITISVNTWSMLINLLFRSGDPQKAVNLFKNMLETGCSPNIVTYTTLIKGYMNFGMANEALSVLSTLQSKGLSPDLVLCNVMIHTFTKLGRFKDARNVLTSLENQKLIPDRYTFASMVSSICLSRNSDLPIGITGGTRAELDLVAGNSLLNYFCKVRLTSEALNLSLYMLNSDLVDCYTYTGFLYALCFEGGSRAAVSVYKGMIRKCIGLDAHVHTAFIDALILLGEYSTAIHLFKRCILEDYPLDVVSYTVAIKGLVWSRRFDEAYSLFCEMKENGILPNRRTYKTIISGLCKDNEADKVRKILRLSIEDGIELDDDTMFKLYRLLARSRDFSEFGWLFESWKLSLMKNNTISGSGFVAMDSGDEFHDVAAASVG